MRRATAALALLAMPPLVLADDPRCVHWAKQGECDTNPGYMLHSCPTACSGSEARAQQERVEAAWQQHVDHVGHSELVLHFNRDGFVPLHITLRPDLAPQTVRSLVAVLLNERHCRSAPCATIYRAEAIPTTPPPSCGEIGHCGPYSLVQGRMEGLSGTPSESAPLLRRGAVARIQGGADFLVALADHEEWGHAFTVFGDARDDELGMSSLENITRLG